MDKETLQRKMIVFRAKYNVSQRKLAKMCNLCVQTINTVELGIQNPSKITIQKILNVIEKGEEKNA